MSDPVAPAVDEPDEGMAPEGLRRVQDFVNSADLMEATDALAGPAEAAAWLREKGLVDPPAAVDTAGAARLRELREALRALILANGGEPLDAAAAGVVARESARAPLRLSVDAAGRPEVTGGGQGVDAAISTLLASVAVAAADGTWARLKACRADNCLWAFYDRSRNASRAWCSMRVCGNRAKARRFRGRRAATAAGPAPRAR